jgi:hypothetical protein
VPQVLLDRQFSQLASFKILQHNICHRCEEINRNLFLNINNLYITITRSRVGSGGKQSGKGKG